MDICIINVYKYVFECNFLHNARDKFYMDYILIDNAINLIDFHSFMASNYRKPRKKSCFTSIYLI